MNPVRRAAVLALLPCLAACMPLSQAALVYTSEIQVGVKVAASTPSNPTPQLNIGYDQTDAAFVPVVVGRPCPSNATSCTASDYPLIVVTGANRRDNSEKLNAQELERRTHAVEEATREVANVQEAIRVARDRNRVRNEELGQLNTAPAPTDSPTPTEEAAPAAPSQEERTARITQLTEEVRNEEQNIQTLNTQLQARQTEQTNAVRARDEFRNATDQTRTNNKDDALSVFGSFNGNVVAGAQSTDARVNATLNLGRVFSTGVASQHLTEGIGQASVLDAYTQCLNTAAQNAQAMAEASRQEALRTMSLACAAGQSRAAARDD